MKTKPFYNPTIEPNLAPKLVIKRRRTKVMSWAAYSEGKLKLPLAHKKYIQMLTNQEAEAMYSDRQISLPKHEKVELKLTPASAFALGREVIKNVVNNVLAI